MPIDTGRRIASYEILAAIGAGGMGEVYRAHDTRLNRDVAIKVLPEVVAGDPELVEGTTLQSPVSRAGARGAARCLQQASHAARHAVIAYERGDWDEAAAAAERVGLPAELLQTAHGDALKWARQLQVARAA